MAKYDPEISGPGNVMLNSTTAQNFEDAEKYAKSILSAIAEGRFLEKNGMSREEYEYREGLGDWDSPLDKIVFGDTLVKWEEGRRKASFSHGYQD